MAMAMVMAYEPMSARPGPMIVVIVLLACLVVVLAWVDWTEQR